MTFNTPPKFAGTFFKRYSRIACGLLVMLALAEPLPAVDMLYVSLNNNTIVSYDTTGNDGTIIAATQAVFANTNLSNAQGLAFDSSGNLYAAIGNTISKFDALGTYVSNISTNLDSPAGLAIDSAGNLYAANMNGSTISKFSSTGAYVGSVGKSWDPTNLWGLAIDSADNLYSGNSNGSSISKFRSSGAYAGEIGSPANVTNPWGLAIDSAGNLYAANFSNPPTTWNGTISKFDSSGTFISRIGSSASLNFTLSLAVDLSGNLYAANFGNATISKFDASGNFLTSWSTGSASPRFLAFKPVSVPEPSTYALAAIATGVIAYLARRRKSRSA